MSRTAPWLLLVALVVGACVADGVPTSRTSSEPTEGPLPTGTRAVSSDAPGPSVRIAPGAPYDGEEILAAMRASTRPGGVAPEIATSEVAARVAESLLTIDGEPWTAFSISGSCAASICSLEVVGVRDDAAGEDVWRFAVDPSTGATEVSDRDLGATPETIVAALDRSARALVELPASVFLASARWMPAVGDGAFALAYRSGNEEESCLVDIELDAARSEILDMTSSDC